ncbi:hypothetical protein J6Y73_00575 [bacterium]|nr:hypothetical protein [bacterium]
MKNKLGDIIVRNESNLYYLTNRYYNPSIGFFITPDSVDYLDSASINGLNLYAYCIGDKNYSLNKVSMKNGIDSINNTSYFKKNNIQTIH